MGELVDEQPLPRQTLLGEIVTIGAASWVKVDMAVGRHGHPFGLKGKPFAAPQTDRLIIEGIAKNRPGEGDLAAR